MKVVGKPFRLDDDADESTERHQCDGEDARRDLSVDDEADHGNARHDREACGARVSGEREDVERRAWPNEAVEGRNINEINVEERPDVCEREEIGNLRERAESGAQ